jgi:hypothetical protein
VLWEEAGAARKDRPPAKKIVPPGKLIGTLEKAVEYRNKIVHAGKAPPEGKELLEILCAVEDFLWVCDRYAGHSWAAEYISADIQAAWEKE